MLIEGGYVVTNAHVVWPYDRARIVFPDGSEFLDVPLLNWDLLGDLAVLGPVQTTIDPIELVDGERLVTGSEVFLIGYPGEVEEFPQPTITRGIISRLRQWDAIGMTYFQTDATIAGGQSGGVLVSGDSDVVGVSGFSFTEAGFGLVASAADVLPRVRGLIAGQDVAGLGDRRIPMEGGEREYQVALAHPYDTRVFVINEPKGTAVSVEVTGLNDAVVFLTDALLGDSAVFDDGLTGTESGSATTQFAPPYFLIVGQDAEEGGGFLVTSDQTLVPYDDPDDGVRLSIGQSLVAAMDHPVDVDYFVIDLVAGDTIDIIVDSPNIDAFLTVAFPGAQAEQEVDDDDSGGGLLGLNPNPPKEGRRVSVLRHQEGAPAHLG